MKTRIHNIAQLAAVPPGPVAGCQIGFPPLVEDAVVVIEDERISSFGPAEDAPADEVDLAIDANGGTVVPGLVDCHTHVVFAGSREAEFVQRIRGDSYIEILEAGGGIKNSVRALRNATIDDLVGQSRPRLERMIATGTTTVEAKSGYGLTPDDEIKTLQAIHKLDEQLPIDIVPTFLGAHTVPPEFDGRPDAYLDVITDESLLRRISGEGLAVFADVFCERGAFNVDQSRRFLSACKEHGLTPKIHSEQITNTGATRLAVELGAVSADHLECINEEDIEALKNVLNSYGTGVSPVDPSNCGTGVSPVDPPPGPRCHRNAGTSAVQAGTIPVILPGCSFFLGSEPAPARKLIDAGLPVALATDCNPGSCTIESLPLIMSIAAMMLRMTPAESLVACTANAAAAIGLADRMGAIASGFQADLLILDIPNLNHWAYCVGINPVQTVIKRGRVVFEKR